MRMRVFAAIAGLLAVLAPAAPATADVQSGQYVWENPHSPNARRFTQAAANQIGASYCWGGGDLSGPTYGNDDSGCGKETGPGFDCSGLVHFALGQAGLPMDDRTADGFSRLGEEVKEAGLEPGDLLFYDRYPMGGDGYIEHVAIYLGNDTRDRDATRYVLEAYGDQGLHAPLYRVRVRPYQSGEQVLAKRIFGLTPAPTGTAKALNDGSVLVTWSDRYAAEDGYVILHGLQQRRVGPDVTSTLWTGLPVGTNECFQVRAFINSRIAPHPEQESSDWSDPICANTESPPAVPSGLVVHGIDPWTLQATWLDNSNNEDGFQLDTREGVLNLPADRESYGVTGLEPGTQKCFAVRAVRAHTASPWTPWSCGNTVAVHGPAMPTGVTLTRIGTYVEIHWLDNSPDESGFKVQRRVGTTVGLVGNAGPNSTSVAVYDQPAHSHVCYQVASYNLWGQSAWTGESCVDIP